MWKLDVSERIRRWRGFRKALSHLNSAEAFDSIVSFWSGCPHYPYHLDGDNPSDWPDPWQLIEENCYCDVAKALGMIYTAHLADVEYDSIEMRIYFDPKTKYTYNLVVVNDGEFVLNLVDNAVSDASAIESHFVLRKVYDEKILRLHLF